MLNATTPLWSLPIGVALGTERGLRPVRPGGLLLGFAGVAVVFAPWRHSGGVGWGALAIVGAAMSYAVGFVYMGRRLVGRGIPAISLSSGQMLAATGLTALTVPAGGLSAVRPGPAVVAAALALGVLATGVTFHLTYRIIADEGATDAAAVGSLLPVVSVVSVPLGTVVLGEAFSPRVAAGTVVVLVAVAMTRHGGGAPRPDATQSPGPAPRDSARARRAGPPGGSPGAYERSRFRW